MTGHIEKRGLENWTIVINLGQDPQTGKRKRMSKVVNGPKREAQRVMFEMLQQLQSIEQKTQTDRRLQAD